MSVGNLLGTLSGSFGPHFNLVGVLPFTTLFILLFGLVFSWSETPSVLPNLDTLINKINTLDLKEGTLIFIAIIVFSVITYPLNIQLVRIFEGYWSRHKLVRLFHDIGIRVQMYKLKEAEKKISKLESRQYYPDARYLLPTSLGNVLRAAEIVAGKRYGFSTATIWPRLYPLISDKLRNIMDDQRSQLDVAVSFCAVFVIFTISSLVYYIAIVYTATLNDFPISFILSNSSSFMNFYLLINLSIKYGLWLTIPFLSAILAWLSYRGAISSALAYGKSIQTAFDLHRFDLIKALHFPLPQNLSDEKENNYDLSDFLALGQISKSFKDSTYSH